MYRRKNTIMKNPFYAVLAVLLASVAVSSCSSGSVERKSEANASAGGVVPAWGTDPLPTDTRVVSYILPSRIMWKESTGDASMENEEVLLHNDYGQAVLNGVGYCRMKNGRGMNSILLDFGREIQGGLQIVTGQSPSRTMKVRIRLGESVSEAMSETGGESGATNDHAMRDFVAELPWLGVAEAGGSGFRFARIDVLGEETELVLQEVRAAFKRRDIPYLGSFECSDSRLNDIWMTGAYTVHLNMQNYLWDGIKRDRLVWTGDINPEVLTVAAVFGADEVVGKSLDLSKECYPPTEWMCGISSYSIWWMITHHQWYMYTGDRAYLDEQKEYTEALLENLLKYAEGGSETLPARFLDWPSSENAKGIDSGLQALLAMGLDCGSSLALIWENPTLAEKCSEAASALKARPRDFGGSKQAAALNVLAGMADPSEAAKGTILPGGAKGFSTFYGYYMLEALALSGNYEEAVELISRYWGAMLDLGATTFWEDFDIDWMENAGRIDEFVPAGKVDVHASYGDYCYKGLRHSLCHGWASGPTVWLSSHVLGVKILEPGCRKVAIEPHLCGLEWVRGTFPTPFGVIEISHRAGPDGKIVSEIKAPKEVKIARR